VFIDYLQNRYNAVWFDSGEKGLIAACGNILKKRIPIPESSS